MSLAEEQISANGSRDQPARPGGLQDRHTLHEVGQLVRALEANGPRTEEELAVLVGAAYWERNRYQRVVRFMLSDGILSRDTHGVLRVMP